MAVTLYDIKGNIFYNNDLQDKLAWCRKGEKMEVGFIREYGRKIGYDINPQKATNEFVPDLISTESNVLADLKTQHSPFFQAQSRFGIDPTYAVVFNVKDRDRYEKHYPDIDIIYFVDWVPIKADIHGKIYQIDPLFGIYKTSFKKLVSLLDRSKVHAYQQRVNDNKGNARDSYVFDIRDRIFERLV